MNKELRNKISENKILTHSERAKVICDLESYENLRSKIDKAIEELRKEIEENYLNVIEYSDGEWIVKDFVYGAIERLKRNIGE